MIKKIMMAPLFCLTSSIAGAQIEKPNQTNNSILCAPTEQVIKELKSLGDEPQWMGTSPDGKSQFLLAVNKKDKSWILIRFTDTLGCIVGGGTNSQLIFKKV